jgi:hypothetical protein
MAPEYDWGNDRLKILYPDTWMEKRKERGVMGDCSGKAWAIVFRCKKLVSRVPAADMASQKGRWKGRYVKYFEAPPASIAFFTFPPPKGKPSRENGHTGMLEKQTDESTGDNELAHASPSHNKFMSVRITVTGKNVFFDALTLVLDLD